MKKTFILIPLIIASIISCGPSKAETAAKAQLQAMQDSIANAAEQQRQDALKQQLIDFKSQLAAEQSKLDDTEKWKLLRSEDEKAQQIGEQTKVVEQLKSQIDDLEKQIK